MDHRDAGGRPMGETVKKIGFGLASLGVLAIACQAVLPERYAVNVPLRSILGGTVTPPPDSLSRLVVPQGFALTVFAEDVDGARALRFTPRGDLLVSTPRSDRILLLARDADGDGRSDGRHELLGGLNRPYGVDLHGGWEERSRDSLPPGMRGHEKHSKAKSKKKKSKKSKRHHRSHPAKPGW